MSSLTGAWSLMRLILRRDRTLLPLWVMIMSLLPMATAIGFQNLYSTEGAAAQAATSFANNPAFLTLFGPVFGDTIGSLVAWRSGLVPVIVALISMMTVIRHTRVEEEAGRSELVGAAVVGRHAGLTAAFAVVAAANVIVAALTAVSLMSVGLPAAGSLAFGLAVAVAGVMFAGVGATTAQLTESAGTARGIGLSALGLFYVLRAAGDAGGVNGAFNWLIWLSPFGWLTRLRPYAEERWWLLLLPVVVGVLLVVVAYGLAVRRDHGGGLLAGRLGPASASPRLDSPYALAWRLQRGLLVGWAAGFAVLGLVYGSVAESVADLFRDNPQLGDVFSSLFGDSSVLIDLYLSAVMGLLGLIASAYAIQATLRLRVEEEALRANAVLATAVSRRQWLASHLMFGFVGPTVVLLVAGTSAGLAYGLISDDLARQLPRVIGAALVQLPAVWILVGVAVALFSVVPRVTSWSWGVYGTVLIVGLIGPAIGLSQWVLNLSPFTHVPALPGSELSYPPVLALLLISAGLLAAAFVGFRCRDVG